MIRKSNSDFSSVNNYIIQEPDLTAWEYGNNLCLLKLKLALQREGLDFKLDSLNLSN
jgi:hypothetical protein